MPLVLALLGALLLTPGVAPAQTPPPWATPSPSPSQPWSSSQSNLTPSQRCERSHQDCIRTCFGGDSRTCMSNCDTTRAYCIQNPSSATQPRR